jgi:hypothetical protein
VAGSSEGEANHWPAFVDVLTTVIMVVTFLLVIMSAAVMELSKRVIAELTAAHATAQKVEQASGATQTPSQLAKVGGAAAAAETPSQANETVSAPKDSKQGVTIAQMGGVLRQEIPVEGEERLTIRTRETKETLRLKVAAQEAPKEDEKGVEVQTADTLIRIDFQPTAARLDAPAEKSIGDFVGQKKSEYADATFEIWSFAPQQGSLSEAERIAFYRAVLTRNVLVKSGIPTNRIKTQVRVSDPTEPDHVVRVVVKP